MKAKRIEEIITEMKSFTKEEYHKSELLNEMFGLQNEIVGMTFNEEHATNANLRIWDVEKHLEELNEDCGNIADEELQKFKEGSKTLSNLIKAEISGNRGEYKAFKTLEYLKSNNMVIKNVELIEDELRTEIDAIVITPKCVTLVEVKNTGKDILIDEDGNYYRTGEFLKWDCNIAEKMEIKERLVRNLLGLSGYDNVRIRSVVVFTNNRIEVQNKFANIRTCFVNHLAYVIDGYKLEDNISLSDMEKIQNIINEGKSQKRYPFEFDVCQYKRDFANLLATLEFARDREVQKEEVRDYEKPIDCKKHTQEKLYSFSDMIKTIFTARKIRHTGSIAAAVALTVISGAVAITTINKGGI